MKKIEIEKMQEIQGGSWGSCAAMVAAGVAGVMIVAAAGPGAIGIAALAEGFGFGLASIGFGQACAS